MGRGAETPQFVCPSLDNLEDSFIVDPEKGKFRDLNQNVVTATKGSNPHESAIANESNPIRCALNKLLKSKESVDSTCYAPCFLCNSVIEIKRIKSAE